MLASTGQSGGALPVLVACAAAFALTLVAIVLLAVRRWRVDATLKASTDAERVSLGVGLQAFGFSASAAAILGGPGVMTVHVGGREALRRSVPAVSVDVLLGWLERPTETASSGVARRLVGWLVQRTDLSALPGLGGRLLLGVHDLSLRGDVVAGFDDPALTGRAAAWLYPVAGVLSPFGALDVAVDWTGKTRLDGEVELSFRVVPARVALEALRFARRHLHLRRDGATAGPLPASSTP